MPGAAADDRGLLQDADERYDERHGVEWSSAVLCGLYVGGGR
ncbi:hypothetical protein ACFYPB_43465 [Streptomyces olivaceoviridis]